MGHSSIHDLSALAPEERLRKATDLRDHFVVIAQIAERIGSPEAAGYRRLVSELEAEQAAARARLAVTSR